MRSSYGDAIKQKHSMTTVKDKKHGMAKRMDYHRHDIKGSKYLKVHPVHYGEKKEE